MGKQARYSRQMSLPEVGAVGQSQLAGSRVLLVGGGGLGNAVIQTLTAAGVGHIRVVDGDEVAVSNLARQPLFTLNDVGRAKAHVLAEVCQRQNPDVMVEAVTEYLDKGNITAFVTGCTVVVDCSDDAGTKYLLNEYCLQQAIPLVVASLAQWSGYALLVDGAGCYSCLFPRQEAELPTCAQAGVISSLPALFGQLQSSMVLQVLLGMSGGYSGKLWHIDLRRGEAAMLNFEPDDSCPVCVSLHRRDPASLGVITLAQLDEALLKGGKLLDVRTPEERQAGHMGGEHVPFDALDEAMKGVDKQTHWLVYCHSGVRSDLAGHWMIKAGFKRVSNVIGGYAAWQMQQRKSGVD